MNSLDKKFKLIDSSFKVIEAVGWDDFSFKKLSYKENISLKIITDILKLQSSSTFANT